MSHYNYKWNPYPLPFSLLVGFFQRVWFLWNLVIFVATGIVFTSAYFIVFNLFSKEKAYKYSCVLTRWWGSTWFALALVRWKNEGATQIDMSKPYVCISNHLSAFDIHACSVSNMLPFSFLAKIEVDKIPFVGYLARNMHVYVDRKSPESRQKSFQRMVDHLNLGRSIHLYVEGTRNTTEHLLKDFHDGAFRLAIETQTPIYMATLVGTNRVMNTKEFRAMPTTIRCIWEEPISTVGLTMDDMEDLKSLVRQKMIARLEAAYAEEKETSSAWW